MLLARGSLIPALGGFAELRLCLTQSESWSMCIGSAALRARAKAPSAKSLRVALTFDCTALTKPLNFTRNLLTLPFIRL
jgi:hypothetical protein